jgi:hypothetical protein
MVNAEVVGLAVGVLFTFLIFTYLLGDNFLYRFALYLLVGMLLGYTFGVVFLFGREVVHRLAGGEYALVIPLILGILLLIKGFPKYAYIGNFPVAFLIGVGAAVALSGALLGTLIPQIGATGHALSDSSRLPQGLVVVFGTVCTLLAFDFTLTARKRPRLVEAAAGFIKLVGRVFLIFAFGVVFAGALTASLSIFIGRVQYIIDALETLGQALGLL